jgi:Aspartyl protease/Domain of unknown function (DUF4124)
MKQMPNMPIGRSAVIFSLSLLFCSVESVRGDFYRYVDEQGVVHVTDNPSQIPPKYRNQLEKRTLQETSQPEVKTEIQRRTAGRTPGTSAVNLKHFEVPYQAFEGTSRRIIIPVTFNESVSAKLLLDTGSPGLLISPKLANRLGMLDEEAGRLWVIAGGIGGSVPAILSVVDSVTVGEARTEFLPATIAPVPSSEFEGLVGMDFIANYRMGIDSHKSVIVFDELPPDLERPGGHDETWWHTTYRNFAGLRGEWGNYLNNLRSQEITYSEKERLTRIARDQYDEADKLFRKLERFARDNAVPMEWRH